MTRRLETSLRVGKMRRARRSIGDDTLVVNIYNARLKSCTIYLRRRKVFHLINKTKTIT